MDFSHAMHVLGTRVTQGPTLAFLILTFALIVGPRLAERIRLPAMVGLVLAGMALGPHGTRILATDKIALSALGDFGLLYLMFAAGLELDLKRFAREKKAAITFALLSFAIPFSLGLGSAKLLGYGMAAAVLMGSNWGSHTLVTYPILRKMGLARNPAVAMVVGATAVTDTSALLVLAGVSGSVKKGASLGLQGAEIAVGLVVLGVWTIVVLPKVARWFFARVGSDRAYRYVFTLVAFLSGAVLAEAAGIDGIVGAFFAGLGLNRAIPERSVLMERVQFMGSSLFIPIFLVSVGVLLDPKVMIDPKTLLVALIFTVAVLGGKALAGVIAGRAFHFSWPEIGVIAGLSGSQAAATLATTLVGAKLGLFDKLTINAVLVVILASLVVTPALVSFFGKKVTRSAAAEEALGSSVLVTMWGDSTRPLLNVAGKLAADDSGIVTAASFATDDAPESELAAQRSLKDKADEWLAAEGARGQLHLSRLAIGRRGALANRTRRMRHADPLRMALRRPRPKERGGTDAGAFAGADPARARRRRAVRAAGGRGPASGRHRLGAPRPRARGAAGDADRARSPRGLRRRGSGVGRGALSGEGGADDRAHRERRRARLGAGERARRRPPHVLRPRRRARGDGADSRARSETLRRGRRGARQRTRSPRPRRWMVCRIRRERAARLMSGAARIQQNVLDSRHYAR